MIQCTESQSIMKATPHNVLAYSYMLTSAAVAAIHLSRREAIPDFDLPAERTVSVRVRVFDHRGMSAVNRLVDVFDATGEHQRVGGGMTDDNGMFETDVRLPNHVDHVMLRAHVLGIDNEALVEVLDDVAEHVMI
jgi:hypothetical protein